MSYKQIEKMFDEKFLWEVRPVGVKKGDKDQEEYVLGMPILDWAEDATLRDIKSFLHLIYDQAKAEQREEDARIAEGKKSTYKGGDADGPQRRNWSRQGYRQASYDIAKAIRQEGKE